MNNFRNIDPSPSRSPGLRNRVVDVAQAISITFNKAACGSLEAHYKGLIEAVFGLCDCVSR